MHNDPETGLFVLKLAMFLVVLGPIFLYPQIYAIYKLVKKIKNSRQEGVVRVAWPYFVILLILSATGIFYAFFLLDNPPFLLRLSFYVVVLPIYMVCLSFLAGMGKAFEAGFSARKFLDTLDTIQHEKGPTKEGAKDLQKGAALDTRQK